MLNRLILLVFLLLLSAPVPFAFAAAAKATKPAAKMQKCAGLVETSTSLRQPPNFENVNWQLYKNNLRAMGYPDHIIKDKIKELQHVFVAEDGQLEQLKTTVAAKSNWNHRFTKADYKKLASNALFLKELGYWVQLPHFDATRLADTYLSESGDAHRDDENEWIKQMSYWAHLWIGNSPSALKRLRTFIQLADNLADGSWLQNYLDRKSQKKFQDYLHDSAVQRVYEGLENKNNHHRHDDYLTSLLQALTLIPLEEFPHKIRKEIAEWVDLKTYPPLSSDRIRVCNHGNYDAGTCADMSYGHLASLGIMREEDGEYHRTVLVKVGGELAGAIKTEGEPSFLALKNIVTSDGRLVLALGGVYHVPKDLIERISGLKTNRKKWHVVELDTLQVEPSVFLINYSALTSDDHFLSLIESAQDIYSKNQIIDLIRRKGSDSDLSSLLSAEEKRAYWREIVRLIDKKRQEIETAPQSIID